MTANTTASVRAFADRRWLTREEIESAGDIGDAPAVGFHIRGCSTRCWTSANAGCSPTRRTASAWRPSGSAWRTATRSTTPVRTGADAQHDRPHGLDGRGDGDRGLQQRRPAPHHGPDGPSGGQIPGDHLPVLYRQYEVQRLGGRPRPGLLPRQGPIIEEMEGLRFKVGPKSFYQTNSAQAYELYKVARDFADLRPGDVLYDLYTGTGTSPTSAPRVAPGWWAWSTSPKPSPTPRSIRN